MPVALLALAVSAFGVGTTEFIMMGLVSSVVSDEALRGFMACLPRLNQGSGKATLTCAIGAPAPSGFARLCCVNSNSDSRAAHGRRRRNCVRQAHARGAQKPRYEALEVAVSSVIGSERIRLPVAAKIALHSAGAIGGKPGSPTPPNGMS